MEIAKQYEFASWSLEALLKRKDELFALIAASEGGHENCDIELLRELSAIMAALRPRTSKPAKPRSDSVAAKSAALDLL